MEGLSNHAYKKLWMTAGYGFYKKCGLLILLPVLLLHSILCFGGGNVSIFQESVFFCCKEGKFWLSRWLWL